MVMIANSAFLYLQRNQPESGGRPSIDRISFSKPSRLPDRTSGGRWLVHPGLLPCRARFDRPLVAVECRRVQSAGHGGSFTSRSVRMACTIRFNESVSREAWSVDVPDLWQSESSVDCAAFQT